MAEGTILSEANINVGEHAPVGSLQPLRIENIGPETVVKLSQAREAVRFSDGSEVAVGQEVVDPQKREYYREVYDIARATPLDHWATVYHGVRNKGNTSETEPEQILKKVILPSGEHITLMGSGTPANLTDSLSNAASWAGENSYTLVFRVPDTLLANNGLGWFMPTQKMWGLVEKYRPQDPIISALPLKGFLGQVLSSNEAKEISAGEKQLSSIAPKMFASISS